jgi:serpin B
MKKRTYSLFIFVFWVSTLILGSCAPPVDILPVDTEPIPIEETQPVEEVEETQAVEPVEASVKVLQSEQERDLNPSVSDDALTQLVADNNDFAWAFFEQARSQEGNLFFSPYSISVALAMTYAGAREQTAAQMAETMHYSLPIHIFHPAFNALDLALQGSGEDYGEMQPFELNIANAIWGQIGHPFLPEFLDTLAMNYGAGLRLTDFQNALEESRQEINQWVEDQTKGRIKDLIPEGSLMETTRLVLTNAIYFKADWMMPFSSELTMEKPFNLLDGSQVDVEMMAQSEEHSYPYTAGDGYQAIEMPYIGNQVSMLLIVPDQGNYEAIESQLNTAMIQSIDTQIQEQMVDLSMPKFSFTWKLNLKEALEKMGMRDAFQWELADFSGMDGKKDLHIQNIFHKAFVAVDEKGTEAAAATAVDMSLEAMMEPGVELIVDRPFIFLIRHQQTGTILFAGRMLDPSEGE